MAQDKFTVAPPECHLHNLCGGYCETKREVERKLCWKCLEVNDAHWARAHGEPLSFGYTNYRGEFSQRRATPTHFEFESTEHHLERQWIMHAIDHDKGAMRAFALKDMVLPAREYDGKDTITVGHRDSAGHCGSGVSREEEVVPMTFDYWHDNVREPNRPYSTMSMRKERAIAYAAGIAAALGQKK